MQQMLVVDPKWVEEVHDELKTQLLNNMMAAESIAKKWRCHAEFMALKHCHTNPWNPPILRDILAGKSENTSTGKTLSINFGSGKKCLTFKISQIIFAANATRRA